MKKLSTRLTAVAAGVALTALIGCRGETEATTDSGASGNPWNESNITTPGPAIGGNQPTMSGDAAQQDRTVASTDRTQTDEVMTNRGIDSSGEDRDARLRESSAPGSVDVDRDFDRSMRAARPDRN